MALATFGMWLAVHAIVRHRRSRVLWGDRSGPELNAAAERLAGAVREQLGRAERLRRLPDPAPIPVRWDTAPRDLIRHRSVPEACELLDEHLAARAIPRPRLSTREPFSHGQSRCYWSTGDEMMPKIDLVVTVGRAEPAQSAVQEAVRTFRTADAISEEHGRGRRMALDLGQEAVWWRFETGGQVLVRQDNVVVDMDLYGYGPAADARLPVFAEEVLRRALTQARRGD